MRKGLVVFIAVLAVFAPSHGQVTVVPRNSTWKYYAFGEAPSGWQLSTFDDSSWPAGPAQLGYGDGDEQTVLVRKSGPPPTTVYFRHWVTTPSPASFSSMTVRILADDGAIVYVNGVEAIRRNMPTGAVSYATAALTNIETNEDRFVQFGISQNMFHAGPNIIAVEVHQYPAGNEDSSFDLEVLANLPNGPPTVAIISPTNGAVLGGTEAWIEAEASDVAGHIRYVNFYTNGVWLGTVAAEPFRIWWAPLPPGRHTIEAQAFNYLYAFENSAPVRVEVGDVATNRVASGPYLQCGSPTNVTVRWLTDWPSDSVVRYGTSLGFMKRAVTNSATSAEHELNITGLEPDTIYYYSVGTTLETLAGGDDFQFRTSTLTTRPVRVWVVGDSGTGDQNAAMVRDAYYDYTGTARTDLMLMLGDNAYGPALSQDYQRFVFDMYGSLLRQTVVWPVIGNHDAGDSVPGTPELYLKNFTLPKNGEAGGLASGTELYYSFDYANIHFIALDSFVSDRDPAGPMLTWLEQDLAATEKDWIIAYWHHPPYSKGTHDSDADPFMTDMRERALPILESYGVDLVLCGHSHVYERSYLLDGHYGHSETLQPSMVLNAGMGRATADGPYRKPSGGIGAHLGTVYAVCGCSGQGGIVEFPRHPAMALNLGGFGSMILEIDGQVLNARFLRPYGDVDDAFTIDKSAPAGIRPMLQADRGSLGAILSWPTSTPAFALEWTDLLPASFWQPVPLPVTTNGRQNIVTVGTNSANRFFQLRAVP